MATGLEQIRKIARSQPARLEWQAIRVDDGYQVMVSVEGRWWKSSEQTTLFLPMPESLGDDQIREWVHEQVMGFQHKDHKTIHTNPLEPFWRKVQDFFRWIDDNAFQG